MNDLFADQDMALPTHVAMAEGAWLLRGHALPVATALIGAVEWIVLSAPFRHMVTPGGHHMSVETTSCGRFGWVSDTQGGYRYSPIDPMTRAPWPQLPHIIMTLAQEAAELAGYAGFTPDSCLVNRYAPDAKMALHQDKDEHDMQWPIVSISLGLEAVFQFGGHTRQAPVKEYVLQHGDIVVWGGPSRLLFHGIKPLKWGDHPLTGECRINLTLRHTQ